MPSSTLLAVRPCLAQPPAPDDAAGWQEIESTFDVGAPLVRLSINDSPPEWFRLELSIEYTFIDEAYAKLLGLAVADLALPEKARQAGAAWVEARIKAGDRPLAPSPIASGPMEHKRDGQLTEKGIISGQMLAGHAVRIDLQGKSIKIRDSAGYRATGHVVPILPRGHELLAPTVVEANDGQQVGTFVRFSFNYPAPAYFHPDWLRNIFMRSGAQPDTARGVIRTLRLGGLELSDVMAYQDPLATESPGDTDGTLGRGLLERFIVTFDLDRRRAVLEPLPEWQRPFAKQPVPARPTRAQEPTPWKPLECLFLDDYVLTRVTIGDSEPMWFVVDTGAPFCAVDEAVAARLGVESRRSDGHADSGRDQKSSSGLAPPSKDPSPEKSALWLGPEHDEAASTTVLGKHPPKPFGVGPYQFVPDNVGVFPLTRKLAGVYPRIAGILGGSFFEKFAVRIEYASKTASLCPASLLAYDGQGDVLPITWTEGGKLCVAIVARASDLQMAGETVTLDSGAHGTIDFRKDAGARFDPEILSKPMLRSGGTLYGPVFTSGFVLGSLLIGSRELTDVPVDACEFPEGVGGTHGLLGTEILRRFTMIVDVPRQRVILEPNERINEPFQRRRSGLTYEPVQPDLTDPRTFEGLRIESIDHASPAEQAGLRVGDLIIALDGEVFEDATWFISMSRAARRTSGAITLRIRRATEVLDVVVTPAAEDRSQP